MYTVCGHFPCFVLCDTGGGQYGDVYEAVWKRYNKTVAVKTLKVSRKLFPGFKNFLISLKSLKMLA